MNYPKSMGFGDLWRGRLSAREMTPWFGDLGRKMLFFHVMERGNRNVNDLNYLCIGNCILFHVMVDEIKAC